MKEPRSFNDFTFQMKLLNIWIQSHIVNTKHVVVGFRDGNFNLVDVKEFKTKDIPNMIEKLNVKPVWTPRICTGFALFLLDFLVNNVKEHLNYICEYAPSSYNSASPFGQIFLY